MALQSMTTFRKMQWAFSTASATGSGEHCQWQTRSWNQDLPRVAEFFCDRKRLRLQGCRRQDPEGLGNTATKRASTFSVTAVARSSRTRTICRRR